MVWGGGNKNVVILLVVDQLEMKHKELNGFMPQRLNTVYFNDLCFQVVIIKLLLISPL